MFKRLNMLASAATMFLSVLLLGCAVGMLVAAQYDRVWVVLFFGLALGLTSYRVLAADIRRAWRVVDPQPVRVVETRPVEEAETW